MKGALEIVKSSKKGTWKFSEKVKRLMKGLGNLEILEKGNLEILRKSKMAHEGNIKSGSYLKYLLVYFKTKTNISDTAKIVC